MKPFNIENFFKKARPDEKVSINGHDVYFLNKTLTFLPKPLEDFITNMNFVTIASVQPQDVLIDNFEFKEPLCVFISYAMHRLIQFTLPAMSLKELIWNISVIYSTIFKSYSLEADVCCNGYEFLYLTRVRLHEDNIISLQVEYKEYQLKAEKNKHFDNQSNQLGQTV